MTVRRGRYAHPRRTAQCHPGAWAAHARPARAGRGESTGQRLTTASNGEEGASWISGRQRHRDLRGVVTEPGGEIGGVGVQRACTGKVAAATVRGFAVAHELEHVADLLRARKSECPKCVR